MFIIFLRSRMNSRKPDSTHFAVLLADVESGNVAVFFRVRPRFERTGGGAC